MISSSLPSRGEIVCVYRTRANIKEGGFIMKPKTVAQLVKAVKDAHIWGIASAMIALAELHQSKRGGSK
jgi:hypothetical protein